MAKAILFIDYPIKIENSTTSVAIWSFNIEFDKLDVAIDEKDISEIVKPIFDGIQYVESQIPCKKKKTKKQP